MNRQFGGSICDGIGIGWIVTSVINQKIGVGDFMLYFGSISQFSGYVTKMMNGMNHLKKSSLDVCVSRNFLEMKDENPKRAGKPLPTKNELPVSITFDHVSFCYPNTTQEKQLLLNCYAVSTSQRKGRFQDFKLFSFTVAENICFDDKKFGYYSQPLSRKVFFVSEA